MLSMHRMKLLWELFWSFIKISPVTFGGGYAMVPLIEKEIVDERKWIKAKDMPDMLALAGTAPGAIGINTSILIGFRVGGYGGAVAAVAGMMLPTSVIIISMAALLIPIMDHTLVKAALRGMAPAIVAIILYAGYRVGRSCIHDRVTLCIALTTVFFLLFVPISPVWLIILGGSGSFLGSQLYHRLLRDRIERRRASRLQAKEHESTKLRTDPERRRSH